ncbi:MAG: ATP-binding protein [Hyphomicrobiales bacterium]
MAKIAGGQESPLSRPHTETSRPADLAFADLDHPVSEATIDLGAFRAGQIASVINASPMLLIANAGIALCFGLLAVHRFAPLAVFSWALAAAVPSLLLLLYWWRNRDRQWTSAPLNAIRQTEVCATVLGFVWAAMPALFFDAADHDMKVLIVALAFAISGIGTYALAYIPTAAILFSSLIVGSLSITSVKLGGEVGLSFGFFTVLYGLVMAGLVLYDYRLALRHAAAGQEVQRQKDIISLLLNDFEQGASDWLWETDRDGRLTYFSQRLCDVLRQPAAAVERQSLAGAAGVAPGWTGWVEFAAAMAERLTISDCLLEAVQDGERVWWHVDARPLFGGNGEFIGYRGVGRDVTEERNAQEQLVRAKETAEAASAAKSQFLSVMSHELRTPLNSIVGFSQLLVSSQADYLNDAARNEYFKTILESSNHLKSLIDDILDATRIDRGTLTLFEQEMDAAELIEVAVKMCRDAAEKADVTIVARVVDGIELKGDVTRLKQVLINLIANAAKFSKAGEFVNVAVERSAGGGLAIAVRDSGIGIKPDDIERIFEPFVQADEGMSRRFGGVGLGLSIARKIARLHNGDVTIASQAGSGTTASLLLPAARVIWPKPATSPSAAATAAA